MEPALIGFVVLVVLVAGIAQTVAGFGFALIAVPPLIAMLEPEQVVVMVAVLALTNSALVLYRTWSHVPWRTVAVMLAASLTAMPLGLAVLLLAPGDLLRIAVGVASVLMALALVSGVRFGDGGSGGHVIAGAASGILATSTGMNGPPIVLHLAGQRVPPVEFRGALAAFFLASGVMSITLFTASGVVTGAALGYALFGLPVVFAGNAIGHYASGRIDQDLFRILVLSLLIVTASVAVAIAIARIAG